MQRAPCWRSRLSSRCRWNSFQSRTRSIGARSTGSSRRYSMNPVVLPTSVALSETAHPGDIASVLLERDHDRLVSREALLFRALDRGEHALVVLRDDFHECAHRVVPPLEQAPRAVARRVLDVTLDEPAHRGDLLSVLELLEHDHLLVHVAREVAALV